MRQTIAEQLSLAVLAALQFFDENNVPTHIRIFFPSGPPMQIPIKIPVAGKPAEASADLTELILDALAESDTPLKCSAIARRVGRKYDGHFRRTVKAMREAGDIEAGEDGAYSLAD